MKLFRHLLAAGFALSLLAIPATALDLSLDGNLRGQCGTVTATGDGTAGTATLNNKCGVVTTESLTGPTASEYTLTLTNSSIAAADIVLWSVGGGTNTTGLGGALRTTPAAGSATLVVRQMSSASFNGTITLRYFVIKP